MTQSVDICMVSLAMYEPLRHICINMIGENTLAAGLTGGADVLRLLKQVWC